MNIEGLVMKCEERHNDQGPPLDWNEAVSSNNIWITSPLGREIVVLNKTRASE
jgi:hypothetical protein